LLGTTSEGLVSSVSYVVLVKSIYGGALGVVGTLSSNELVFLRGEFGFSTPKSYIPIVSVDHENSLLAHLIQRGSTTSFSSCLPHRNHHQGLAFVDI